MAHSQLDEYTMADLEGFLPLVGIGAWKAMLRVAAHQEEDKGDDDDDATTEEGDPSACVEKETDAKDEVLPPGSRPGSSSDTALMPGDMNSVSPKRKAEDAPTPCSQALTPANPETIDLTADSPPKLKRSKTNRDFEAVPQDKTPWAGSGGGVGPA